MALIAAQMYTLRDHCKTPAEIAAACAKVKKMGYDGVQMSGTGPIEPTELKKILDGEGLLCAATHRSLEQLETSLDAVIEEHQIIGCKYTAIGGFSPKDNWTRAGWGAFVTRYNDIAAKLAGTGLRLGYHNHSHEFAPAEGMLPMDLLINTLEREVWLEIDTYWVAHGGGDPAAYIERVAGRIPCVHFKDMTMMPDRTPKMCEIGDGNLNWPRIVQACRYAGVIWYIVERDRGDLDPFDSLQRSIDNMRENMGL